MGWIGDCSQEEIIYCSDVPADSCGCLEDEDPCDSSGATGADSDDDDDDDDDESENEQSGMEKEIHSLMITKVFFLENQRNFSLPTKSTNNIQLDEFDLEDDGIEDGRKEMQSLL